MKFTKIQSALISEVDFVNNALKKMKQLLKRKGSRLPSVSSEEPPKPQSGPTPRPVFKPIITRNEPPEIPLKEKQWWQYVGDISWFADNRWHHFSIEEIGEDKNYLLYSLPNADPFKYAKWPNDYWQLISRTRLWRHYVEYTGTAVRNYHLSALMVETGDDLPGQWFRCEKPEALGDDMLWAIQVVDPNEAPRVRADD